MKIDKEALAKYEDMIHLDRPISKDHPPMPLADRAVQFAPFAAVSGYDEAVSEAARVTQQRKRLDELAKATLDEKFRLIEESLDQEPLLEITYFVPDALKEGGAYVVKKGVVKKVDPYKKLLLMGDDTIIPIREVSDIKGDIFLTYDTFFTD